MMTTRKAYIQNVLLSSIRTKAFPRDKGVTYAADRRGSQFTQITCDHESHISKMTSKRVLHNFRGKLKYLSQPIY